MVKMPLEAAIVDGCCPAVQESSVSARSGGRRRFGAENRLEHGARVVSRRPGEKGRGSDVLSTFIRQLRRDPAAGGGQQEWRSPAKNSGWDMEGMAEARRRHTEMDG